MNIAGKMKITVGKSILIGAFIALSSAAAWRWARVGGLHAEDAAERDAELVGLDDRADEAETSGVSTRSASFFSASWRVSPMRISPSASANSSASGPSMCSVSFAIAPSKPSPAST